MGCLFSVPEGGYLEVNEERSAGAYDSLSTASGIDDLHDERQPKAAYSMEDSSADLVAEDGAAVHQEVLNAHDDAWCRFDATSDATNEGAAAGGIGAPPSPLDLSLDSVVQQAYQDRVLVVFSGKAFGIALQLQMHWAALGASSAAPECVMDARVPESLLRAVHACLRAHMHACERIANRWNPDSELSAACSSAHPKKAVEVGTILYALLAEAHRLHRVTGGRFDPTCGALWRGFRATLRSSALQRPPKEERFQLDWEKVGWSELVRLQAPRPGRPGALVLTRSGVCIDLDGMLKGWIIDQIDRTLRERFGAERLLLDDQSKLQSSELVAAAAAPATDNNGKSLENRISPAAGGLESSVSGAESAAVSADPPEGAYQLVGAFLDWGSEIRAWGRHPSGRPWRTLVIRPPPLEQLFSGWKHGARTWIPCLKDAAFSLAFEDSDEGFGLATSGDYYQMERFGFYHILCPLTRRVQRATKDSIASATVLAKDAATADALATAAMTFQKASDAAEWLQGHPQVLAYCLVTRQIYSKNAAKSERSVFYVPPFQPLPSVAVLMRSEFEKGPRIESTPRAASPRILPELKTGFMACSAAAALLPRVLFLVVAALPSTNTLGIALVDTVAVCSLSPPCVSFHMVVDDVRSCTQPADTCSGDEKPIHEDVALSAHGHIGLPDALSLYLLTNAHQPLVERIFALARMRGASQACGSLVHLTDLNLERDALPSAPALQVNVRHTHPLTPEFGEYLVVAEVQQLTFGTPDPMRLLLYFQNQLGTIELRCVPRAPASEPAERAEELRRFASALPKAVAVLTLQRPDCSVQWLCVTSLRCSASSRAAAFLSCNIQRDAAFARCLREAYSTSTPPAAPVTIGIQILNGRQGGGIPALTSRFDDGTYVAEVRFDTELRTGTASAATAVPPAVTQSVRAAIGDAAAVLAAEVHALADAGDHELVVMRACAAWMDASSNGRRLLIRCQGRYRALRLDPSTGKDASTARAVTSPGTMRVREAGVAVSVAPSSTLATVL